MAERLIGIIGGSGLYDMEGLETIREETVRTPFGDPSDALSWGDCTAGRWRSWPATGGAIA